LPLTEGFQPDSDFSFTISPDDQWLVFFARPAMDDVEPSPTQHLYGRLRLLNLRTMTLHRFQIHEDQAPSSVDDVDASWAADSSIWVFPPPPQVDRRIVVRFVQGVPTVEFMPDPRSPRRGPSGELLPPPEELMPLPERFTCSDCFPHTNDFELFRKHIPKGMLYGDSTSSNRGGHQIVSPDGTKIYYQKGPQGREGVEGFDETTLYEIDIATGTERALMTHRDRERGCPSIDDLRPSPDGKKLAYQVTTGCGFVSIPTIYILDLATRRAQAIAGGTGIVHWSSTSNKLYFYRKELGMADDRCLWYAEFPHPAVAIPAP
jgi:hypothetical protein